MQLRKTVYFEQIIIDSIYFRIMSFWLLSYFSWLPAAITAATIMPPNGKPTNKTALFNWPFAHSVCRFSCIFLLYYFLTLPKTTEINIKCEFYPITIIVSFLGKQIAISRSKGCFHGFGCNIFMEENVY